MIRFSLVNGADDSDGKICYESALAKSNAIVLLYSLAHSLCRKDEVLKALGVSATALDFYLCCGFMVALYVVYLVARSRGSRGGMLVNLTLKSETGVVEGVTAVEDDSSKGGNSDSKGGSNGNSESSLTKKLNEAASSSGGGSSSSDDKQRTVSSLADMASTIPPVSTWIHSPLLIRAAPTCPHSVDGIPCTLTSQLRVNNVPIPFETDLFVGSAMIRVANLPSSPINYFNKRNRKLQVAIQGKFKTRTRFDKVFSGQEFYGPIPSLPPKSVVDTVFALLSSKLPPTFLQDVFSDTPYFLSPLVNTCQGFAVEKDGGVQSVEGEERNKWAIVENTELLGDEVPRDGEKRRKFFAKQENLERFYFDTDKTYTFDYYQHYMDMNSMKFVVTSFLQFDVSRIIGKQPMQLSMAKNMDGSGYFWNFEVWHKTLMDGEK
jgi:hypothetical protein